MRLMKKDDKTKIVEAPKLSNSIAVLSVIGLTVCFVAGTVEHASVPLVLYAIFGSGIMGAAAVIDIIRAIFRLDK
jgi:hypothetical protein